MAIILTRQTSVEFIHCASCGVLFGLTTDMLKRRRKDGENFYCPAGHTNFYRDNENDLIRRERDRLKQEQARMQDEIDHQRRNREAAERQTAAARGQITKLKKRVSNGVCPCCTRSFANLQRHMATQHPAFEATEV